MGDDEERAARRDLTRDVQIELLLLLLLVVRSRSYLFESFSGNLALILLPDLH